MIEVLSIYVTESLYVGESLCRQLKNRLVARAASSKVHKAITEYHEVYKSELSDATTPITAAKLIVVNDIINIATDLLKEYDGGRVVVRKFCNNLEDKIAEYAIKHFQDYVAARSVGNNKAKERK